MAPGGATAIPVPISSTDEYWQGAYVFNVNPNSGFTLQGKVTHLDTSLLDSQGFINQTASYIDTQNNEITRSLYIGNSLYTRLKRSKVKLSSLEFRPNRNSTK